MQRKYCMKKAGNRELNRRCYQFPSVCWYFQLLLLENIITKEKTFVWSGKAEEKMLCSCCCYCFPSQEKKVEKRMLLDFVVLVAFAVLFAMLDVVHFQFNSFHFLCILFYFSRF